MRLYVDYDLLNSSSSPSAAAYTALRHAKLDATSVIMSGPGARQAQHPLARNRRTPVLVTDDGHVIAGLSAIVAWADGLA